jgi:adenylate cyclase
VGAPTTALSVHFVLEWWARRTTAEVFPHEVLASLPRSARINVLPKLLVVTLTVGTLPIALMSQIVLGSISDIQAGVQSPESFLAQMPQAIWFLLVWAVALATGLSVFMSKSVSQPLRYARAALGKLSKGDLDTIVPVVSNDDIGQMAEQLNRMVQEHKELDSLRDTFGRYLSQEVVEEILKSAGGVELGGELRTMTVMVADLRGFTSLAESHHPRVVLELLNRYLERMTDIIITYEGTIDEFTGDGVLVFFGAPRLMEDHARRAVACALEMQECMHALNRDNRDLGLPDLHMGIGINSGELIVGNIGSEKRKKYGAVGSPINVAFRVEGHSAAGEVLLTPTVYDHLDGRLEVDSTREVQLKGLEKSLLVYSVVGLSDRSG